MEPTKEELLSDIDDLISYGASKPTISQDLLEYLEISDLESIKHKLLSKVGKLSLADKEWLEQFKKYD